jgi:RNA ligase (TIGR02306 family)
VGVRSEAADLGPVLAGPPDAAVQGAEPAGSSPDAGVAAGVPGSEWGVTVVRIVGFTPIPGADFVHVAQFATEHAGSEEHTESVPWDYPVVVQKSTYAVGDKAVYVPVDSTFPPECPEFAFLGSDTRRLRARKLRGVYSEGLLVPWTDVAAIVARTVPDSFGDDAATKAEKTAQALDVFLPVGAEVSELLGITRYVERAAVRPGSGGRSDKVPDASVFPVYTVANAKKGEGIQLLAGDTRVIVTEKLHGANVRFGWVRNAVSAVGERESNDAWVFRLGSHRVMRDLNTESGWFQNCYQANDLEGKTEDLHGFVFYGEILGVQDLTYGVVTPASGLRIFDVYDANSEQWLNWGQIVEACKAARLDCVPVLYDGPLDECNYREMAEGQTCLAGVNHVREGVVIRTFASSGPYRRWKYVGQGYKLRKEQKDLVTE